VTRPDLLALTATLVDIESESFQEQALVAHLEARLAAVPWVSIDRVGDNLVARTNLGRPRRLLLGGHTDTVPANANGVARLEGDTLWGLGAADMKGGLAIMLALAESVSTPAVDVTYLFYAREEVALEHNGLREIVEERPDLLVADLALLGEPTAGAVEAGCQGTMRFELDLVGERAHTARPWMGRNAVHRLGEILVALATYQPRRPVIEGCEYHEALQAVKVEGGVAGNVVPDRATMVFNHRVAPDRSLAEAEAHVRALLAPMLEEGDRLVVVDAAPPAPPGLDNPLLASIVGRHDLLVKAKLGWTDVAFFAERGIPATNFGPGDPALAHTRDERVERVAVDACFEVLRRVLTEGV
jgi:succinyl-diaminopimelate desuccinylase